MTLLLIDAAQARKIALAQLTVVREYRANEQSKALVEMFDAMYLHYQARLVDCPEAEIPLLRAAARQLAFLRAALTTEDVARIALLV